LEEALRHNTQVRMDEGFVYLSGFEDLVDKSKHRAESHRALNGHARTLAEQFAVDLASLCPYVNCIALSGSVASGGYAIGDDIDFDLFVRTDTKYVCYLVSILLGIKYSWRHRHFGGGNLRRLVGFPKVTCINVVWAENETRPFVRQDVALAFELLHCEPLVGASEFARTIAANGWLRSFFPQLFHRRMVDSLPRRDTNLGRLFDGVQRHAVMLRWVNRFCRLTAWLGYTFVQGLWGRDPGARARMEFLRRVKYPYEVFQD